MEEVEVHSYLSQVFPKISVNINPSHSGFKLFSLIVSFVEPVFHFPSQPQNMVFSAENNSPTETQSGISAEDRLLLFTVQFESDLKHITAKYRDRKQTSRQFSSRPASSEIQHESCTRR